MKQKGNERNCKRKREEEGNHSFFFFFFFKSRDILTSCNVWSGSQFRQTVFEK